MNEPVVGEAECRNVIDCLHSGWISSAGSYIEQFEREWAARCGVKYGIAVSNGTTALQIAIDSLGLRPGDEVILPTFTIISCAMAIVRAGLRPVLVDSEPVNWGMDIEQIRACVTPRTRAIMPVHMYGHPLDMDPISALAREFGLAVIEDAAEVHGAEYLTGRDGSLPVWRRCGGLGDLAAFSFYANKLITTGEGGMVVTDDPARAEKLRSLRNLCFRPPRRFYHTELGYNFRMTNVQAAIGVAQVQRLPEIVARKRAIAARYTDRLKGMQWLQLPCEQPWARSVFWVYGVVLPDEVKFDAQEFGERMLREGIETRPFFLGMHEQPVFHDLGLFQDSRGRFPVAERIARRGLYLPAGLAITDTQIDQVCDVLERMADEL
ncbi:MAG TPA: DegT/DnrJ/EryC1/StrS family aminotransferase [Steroidobacteraceae bacterium]|nr:DegT/DnrJ/EryC1/StrS family aminotransferase [Steroidobacteraceae bacterium]